MSKYKSDIIQSIIDNDDFTTFSGIIQEFLETLDNNFRELVEYTTSGVRYIAMREWDEEEEEWVDTSYSGVDYWTSYSGGDLTITVSGWLDAYYQDAYNDAIRSQGGIVITDSNSPHYPLRDWYELMDSVFDSGGLTFSGSTISGTISGTCFVEYEFPNKVYVDRMSIWSTGSPSTYVGYSPNNVDWNYLCAVSGTNELDDGIFVAAEDENEAYSNTWALVSTSGVADVGRFPTGTQAKHIRLYAVGSMELYELHYQHHEEKQSVGYQQKGGIDIDLEYGRIEIKDFAGVVRVRIGRLD